ncbi:LysE family translocator [Pararhizobium mangrovi]|uniref:LysE family translocator n=1 Tax=Pararhizobium mangrovi TaxID=2590452 RepID=A0A506U4V4_9HYPH|nr:LysE family translocator [Pararhizobium mangrovi]TPW26937.1 LysE family translocator [Pararhizobium mangrovi]
MEIQVWLAFVGAAALLLVVPGPTVLLVLGYALSQGRTVALATVAGVALGDLLAMSASLAGLGAIVLASATLFTVLKWIGAAYLFVLGIRLFRSRPETAIHTGDEAGSVSASRVFVHAAMVTAFNPKSIAFFVAFVPQFVAVDRPLFPQFAVLVASFVSLASVNTLAYALLADGLRRRFARPGFLTWSSRLGGGALMGMGLATAMMRRAG